MLDAAGPCFQFTPAQAEAALGQPTYGSVNEDTPELAVGPATGTSARGMLVIFIGGSLSKPTDTLATPSTNFITTAASLGYHALDVAYSDHQVIGQACETTSQTCCADASCSSLVHCAPNRCYPASRYAVALGACQTDASEAVCNNLTPDAAILPRVVQMLDLLKQQDPIGGWDAFVDANTALPAEQRLRWSKLVLAGHSQGGGHAAFIGSIFAAARVVQLSSTCDAVGSTPASWTTWSGSSSTNYLGQAWGTSPGAAYWGLAAATTFDSQGQVTGGDTLCPYHAAIWTNLGMDPSREDDTADTSCITATMNDHAASIRCATNAPRWATMLQ